MPKADRLSPGAVKLLQEPQLAHITTLMRDGSPQVTVLWVDVEPDGSHVMVNTIEGRLKVRNVDRDPRVAVSVVDKNEMYRFAVFRGRVVEKISHEDGADEHIDKQAKKYLGVDTYPNRQPGMRRIILKIKPDHIL